MRAKYEEFLDRVRAIDSANGDVAIADEVMRTGQEPSINRAEILKRLQNELKPALRSAHSELEHIAAAELTQT